MARRTKSAKAKAEGKRPRARKTPTPAAARLRDLETRLAESLKREAEALERLQARDHEVLEGRERETATAEILHVMTQSQPDLQSVLNAVAARAARLCDSIDAQIFRIDGTVLRLAASYGSVPKTTSEEPRPISRGSVNGRAVVDRRTIHLHDLAAESDLEFPEGKSFQRRFGHRTIVATPLLREGAPIGAITIRRTEVRPFSDAQIRLLETFAAEAVIAIEDVRLFNETKETLERQTATSEILRVMSSSPTNVQPVFDSIVASAVRLSGGHYSVLFRYEREQFHIMAQHGLTPVAVETFSRTFPLGADRAGLLGRAAIERRSVQTPDVFTDPQVGPHARELAASQGYCSFLHVPLLRERILIGVLTVTKRETGLFPDETTTLLQTFADQAVIAIENVRLFNELQERTAELTRSVDELTALGEVSQALSSTLDIETVLTTIVSRAIDLSGADGGSVYEYDDAAEEFRLRATQNFEEELVEASRAMPLRRGGGALGMLAERRASVQIADIADPAAYQSPVRDVLLRTGYRALLAVPLLRDDRLIGGLATTSSTSPRSRRGGWSWSWRTSISQPRSTTPSPWSGNGPAATASPCITRSMRAWARSRPTSGSSSRCS
jgi:two-component system NtrC family sensor kinase